MTRPAVVLCYTSDDVMSSQARLTVVQQQRLSGHLVEWESDDQTGVVVGYLLQATCRSDAPPVLTPTLFLGVAATALATVMLRYCI